MKNSLEEQSRMREIITFNKSSAVINLDPQFQPLRPGLEFKSFVFPSGAEQHIKLGEITSNKVLITTRLKSSDEIMRLLLTTDALKRAGVRDIEVFIPYLPYARQEIGRAHV